jgi:hypothetical protein
MIPLKNNNYKLIKVGQTDSTQSLATLCPVKSIFTPE